MHAGVGRLERWVRSHALRTPEDMLRVVPEIARLLLTGLVPQTSWYSKKFPLVVAQEVGHNHLSPSAESDEPSVEQSIKSRNKWKPVAGIAPNRGITVSPGFNVRRAQRLHRCASSYGT